MGSVVGWVVLEAQAERQPALLDLGVRVSRHAEVGVDEGHDSKRNLALVLQKRGVEDRL